MIKKIIGGIALVILITIAVFNSILNNPKDNSNLYSSLTLANIVALAEESESGGGNSTTCRCSSDNPEVCSAANTEQTCASGVNVQCWNYNLNCR
jgi:hypothetical protein